MAFQYPTVSLLFHLFFCSLMLWPGNFFYRWQQFYNPAADFSPLSGNSGLEILQKKQLQVFSIRFGSKYGVTLGEFPFYQNMCIQEEEEITFYHHNFGNVL